MSLSVMDLSNAFSTSVEMVVVLHLFTWCVIWLGFHILSPSCVSGLHPTWSWCIVILSVLLSSGISLRISASVFINDIGL